VAQAQHPVRAGSWSGELVNIVRAASGGLLFGIPLLYTIEVTWIGQHTSPMQALMVLAASLSLLTVLNRTAGFRAHADRTIRDSAMDAVEGVSLAIVLVIGVQVLLGEVDRSTPLLVLLGMTAYDALAVCVGIGIAAHLLGGRDDEDQGDGDGRARGEDQSRGRRQRDAEQRSTPLNATVADLGASLIGAVFVSLSIAPTDEVPHISASRSPMWLLAIIAASLLTAYAIVFVAGFSGQIERRTAPGLLQHPVIETLAAYVVALLAAAAMLWMFQRQAAANVTLTHVIVLGFPAAIGGAAGRLAI
jgi:putative integral membrane protein (TIGR02587 family)